MYIKVAYKDAPELSSLRRRSSDVDLSVEKTLLVNPKCPVRIMLEYIRKTCRLGLYTQFDLCDENGILKKLFNMPTYVDVADKFEHRKVYFVIVIKQESDKRLSVLPQINHDNKIYSDLKNKVKKYITTGEVSPLTTPPIGPSPPPGKSSLSKVNKINAPENNR